jgi:hypothetical protein
MLIGAFDIAEIFKMLWLMEFSKNEEWFELLFLVCVIVLEVDSGTKGARERPKKNWMESIRKVMNERNLNVDHWEDRKQWSLGVGLRRKTFWNRYTYMCYCSVFEENSFNPPYLMAPLIIMLASRVVWKNTFLGNAENYTVNWKGFLLYYFWRLISQIPQLCIGSGALC